MWKHKNFINLQLCARVSPPAPAQITINWDNNITSVVGKNMYNGTTGDVTFTNGNEVIASSYDGTDYTFEVTLDSGYVLDTVTLSSSDTTCGVLKSQTDTSFVITAGSSGISQTITLTSKSAAFDGKINITKSAGVVLKTEGKYCDQDIKVVPVLEEKSITPTESAQEIVPSDGKCGISKLNVGAVQTETKTITPTTSQQTFTPTSGKYFKQVICQAIQIETKTVTPGASTQFVQPSSGKYLANVTVNAVPSQSKTVTPTKSVQTVNADSGKWLSSVTVNPIPDEYIQPSGSQDITANGTYDITDKASVNVNVPTASAVEEVATASAMDALLVEANVGKYYKFTGTTDTNYTNSDLYLVEGGAVSSHTLTFSGVTVTVDGVAVTSPYMLTQDCTIVATANNAIYEVVVTAGSIEHHTDVDGTTLSLTNTDIDITEHNVTATKNNNITINYTA